VYNFYAILGLIAGGVTFGIMIFLLVKYRSKGGAVPSLVKQREDRETWKGPAITVGLMTVVLVLVGGQTLAAFPVTQQVPAGEHLDIQVTARQFFWSFTYPNNVTTTDLIVPAGMVVVLHVTSKDVYHQFGISSFRIKTDAIPGRNITIWIQPTTVGNSTIQCFELCGVGHATMRTTLVVLTAADYQKWYASQGSGTTA